jgi:hypothetical protein
MPKIWMPYLLLLAGCNVATLGDPCTSTLDCGNYVCEVQPGQTQGVCAEPPGTDDPTPPGGSGATTGTNDDTGF